MSQRRASGERTKSVLGGALLLALVAGGCAEAQVSTGDVDEVLQTDTGCLADCSGRSCGSNGCGGTCGLCRPDELCANGVCSVVVCPQAKDCVGRQCGQDPVCGEVCGACALPTTCGADGRCTCLPACSGAQCGPDGCGGECGSCANGQFCAAGTCQLVPPGCPGDADCSGRECGPDPICGTSCGSCDDGFCQANGTCLCAPQCAGRQCGPNGCGGQCGTCGTGATCTAEGTCFCGGTTCGTACCAAGERCAGGACCAALWTHDDDGSLHEVARAPDGTFYVVGSAGTQVRVKRLGQCGALLNQQAFLPTGASTAAGTGILADGANVYVTGSMVSGNDPGNGFLARLDPASLMPTWSRFLWGGDAMDEVVDVVEAAGGVLWMSGTSSIADATGRRWWGVKDDKTTPCGFAVPFDLEGSGRRLALGAGGDTVWMVGRLGADLVLQGFSASCSAVTTPCACTPDTELHVVPPAGATTQGMDLAVLGTEAYLAGYTDVAGDLEGIVVRVDLGSGAVLGSFSWNPTAAGDGFVALEVVADGVVAAGIRGWNGTSWSSGSGFLVKLDRNLNVRWERAVGPGLITDVTGEPDGGLIVVLQADTTSRIERCDGAGICP